MLKFLFIWDIKKKKKVHVLLLNWNRGLSTSQVLDKLEDEHMNVPDQNIHLLPSWDRGSVALCQSEADIDSDDLQGDQEVEG